jgi:crotonobetainyl-CoA:carnitine CoA-transferase CaiB-like acyl-CoA transferase
MADFTAGLLAAVAVLAGLVGRVRTPAAGSAPAPEAEPAALASGLDVAAPAPGLEVSLLGAALAVQAQRFVSVHTPDAPAAPSDTAGPATPADLARQRRGRCAHDELEPYYRTYAGADGFFVLACLHARQRAAAAAVIGLEDPWSANPQAPPADAAEREQRRALAAEFSHRLASASVGEWVRRLRAAGVPAAEVRTLAALFDHDQVRANGLVQTVRRAGVGDVQLLGSVFKIDGAVAPSRHGVPELGEHTEEVLAQCRRPRL